MHIPPWDWFRRTDQGSQRCAGSPRVKFSNERERITVRKVRMDKIRDLKGNIPFGALAVSR